MKVYNVKHEKYACKVNRRERIEDGHEMDIKKYEVLLKAVDLGNLTKAGEQLGYTQSGVSHMMKGLEDEFGFPLLVRGRKGVALTAEGKRIEPILREILKWGNRLNQTVDELNGLETGHINIAALTSVSLHWLPRIIKRFYTQYPNIQVELRREDGVRQAKELLINHQVDMAFISYQKNLNFDWIHLRGDRLMAVLPKDYPEYDGHLFPMKGFEKEPFLMTEFGKDYGIYETLEKSKTHVKLAFSPMDDHVTMSMVESGLGLSILPELLLKNNAYRIRTMPLEGGYSRILGIALPSLEHASPAVKKFLDCTKEVLKEMGRDAV